MSTTTPTTGRVAYQCPQCIMLVHLDLRYRTTANGATEVDRDRLVKAMALHMRVGCGG